MISVPASEVQRNFSEYEEKAVHEPVEVTHAGRRPSYLVSERLFKDMMSSYGPAPTSDQPNGCRSFQRDSCIICALPKNWFALVKQDIIENLKLKRAHVVRRT